MNAKTATITRLNSGSWGVYYSDQTAKPRCIRVPDSTYPAEMTKKAVVMDTARRGYLPTTTNYPPTPRQRGNKGEDKMSAQVSFTESEQGQYIGTWTVETAPNEFLRALAAEAIRTGEPARGTDPEGCEVTATIDE